MSSAELFAFRGLAAGPSDGCFASMLAEIEVTSFPSFGSFAAACAGWGSSDNFVEAIRSVVIAELAADAGEDNLDLKSKNMSKS